MQKYTGLIYFKIDIEAKNIEDATKIAYQAFPAHFDCSINGGRGAYLRGLTPLVFEKELIENDADNFEEESKTKSWWKK